MFMIRCRRTDGLCLLALEDFRVCFIRKETLSPVPQPRFLRRCRRQASRLPRRTRLRRWHHSRSPIRGCHRATSRQAATLARHRAGWQLRTRHARGVVEEDLLRRRRDQLGTAGRRDCLGRSQRSARNLARVDHVPLSSSAIHPDRVLFCVKMNGYER